MNQGNTDREVSHLDIYKALVNLEAKVDLLMQRVVDRDLVVSEIKERVVALEQKQGNIEKNTAKAFGGVAVLGILIPLALTLLMNSYNVRIVESSDPSPQQPQSYRNFSRNLGN